MTSPKTEKTVLFEISDRVALVTINRPDKLNALNRETLTTLDGVIDEIGRRVEEIRAVIITGAGEKAFVAGADISEITGLDAARAAEFAANGQRIFRNIEKLPVPVIAAVNGFALGGGCELAIACHLRIASANAKFGLPEVNLGILPGYGGTQRLPRLIGLSKALHLTLSGEMLPSETALQYGLVNEVVAPAELMPRAHELAAGLARQAPLAVGNILDVMYRGIDLPIDEGLKIEAEAFARVCNTADMKEGTGAFLEKRKPQFKGR